MPTCPICQKHCNSESGLIAHSEAKHGRANVHQGVTAWENSRGQQNLMTTGASVQDGRISVDYRCFDGSEWACPMCQRCFSTENGLSNHVNSGTHSEKAYRCDDCSKQFAKLAQLVDHTSKSSCRHAAHAAAALVNDYEEGGERLMLTNGSDSYEATLYFDGSAQPNPGNGGVGFVLYGVNGRELESMSYSIAGQVTNNEAEWAALVMGMRCALEFNIRTLRIHGDSELVLNQMDGTYGVRSANLRPLYDEAKYIEQKFMRCSFEHVYRSQNTVADELANEGATEYMEEIRVADCYY
jgi:ribonuclease HI